MLVAVIGCQSRATSILCIEKYGMSINYQIIFNKFRLWKYVCEPTIKSQNICEEH